MHLKSLGKKLVVALATAVAMTGGLPAAEAAGGATCGINGYRYDAMSAVYDMDCVGTEDLAGNWRLNQFGSQVYGVGPRGETVTGEVSSVWPICVGTVPWTYCQTVTLTVCYQGWCRTVSATICITYTGPIITVCIEVNATGPFSGNGTLTAVD